MDSKEKLNLSFVYQTLLDKITNVDIKKFTEYAKDKYSESNIVLKYLFDKIESIPEIPIESLFQ